MLGMLGSLHYDPDGTARQLLAILASGDQVLAAQASGGALADHSRTADPLLPACGQARETADLIPNDASR